jgi:hypothetical protein
MCSFEVLHKAKECGSRVAILDQKNLCFFLYFNFGHEKNRTYQKVWLRIRDSTITGPQPILSRIRIFSIPDPHQKFKCILTPKKLFLSSRKYDPGLFIPDPDPDFFYSSRIPGGSKNGTGSRIRIPAILAPPYLDLLVPLGQLGLQDDNLLPLRQLVAGRGCGDSCYLVGGGDSCCLVGGGDSCCLVGGGGGAGGGRRTGGLLLL